MSRAADDNDGTWWAAIARCWCPDHMDGYCCASPSPPQMVPAATQHNKNLSHCFTSSNDNKGKEGERRGKNHNYFCSQEKSVLLLSWCPEGQIPERKQPEWLLVIDWYANESLIIPAARAQRAAYALTAPWPVFWQTVTSSRHITQGLIKHDPEIDKR